MKKYFLVQIALLYSGLALANDLPMTKGPEEFFKVLTAPKEWVAITATTTRGSLFTVGDTLSFVVAEPNIEIHARGSTSDGKIIFANTIFQGTYSTKTCITGLPANLDIIIEQEMINAGRCGIMYLVSENPLILRYKSKYHAGQTPRDQPEETVDFTHKSANHLVIPDQNKYHANYKPSDQPKETADLQPKAICTDEKQEANLQFFLKPTFWSVDPHEAGFRGAFFQTGDQIKFVRNPKDACSVVLSAKNNNENVLPPGRVLSLQSFLDTANSTECIHDISGSKFAISQPDTDWGRCMLIYSVNETKIKYVSAFYETGFSIDIEEVVLTPNNGE